MGNFYSNGVQFRGAKRFLLNSDGNRPVTTVDLTGNDVIEFSNSLVFAKPLNESSYLGFSSDGNRIDGELRINQSSVFASLDTMKIKVTGDWLFEQLSMPQVAILISFLDYHDNPCRIIHSKTGNYYDESLIIQNDRFYISKVNYSGRCLVALLIGRRLRSVDYGIENLFNFVRRIENYWISHFLLSQFLKEEKDSSADRLYNASKSYGVSESYFRKLCHNTFSRGPKKQLRIWRASYSALQLIEKDNSIATIAGNNGYASSSHFSSEIKSIFGIRPREFKDLKGFFYE
ncbi:helix-turn-helix domain-containing protein [Erwinia pyrifoliae]|uniref:Helix-turn-helix domain-containing protein n=1 Tax=Erwinia pyrifoliae TaxID=79967 RepID=A0ABY5X3F1_ERWPY|nr:helix-turn-helix domain-containing protein [Erwinia pyrifoliae]AUX72531.1 type III secretion system protein [Erwinia pyrifoliae]MCA8877215.1 helix-turn-helix domain-containing protein [Erwinia pyrifoliae]MCT2387398.1 helix-turn-helix domain-containing protein [Erwinia pyrifoliae]MCU8587002.1 helix-turn-helix domain-containing protein [Erwinia pyrifoliae]UWS30869.1 helix-turn-helix domain-containing protein [Erwinia pyrifoliae]